MEPLVLFTGLLFSGAFIALEQRLVAAVFLGIAVLTAWLCRRYDERRFR